MKSAKVLGILSALILLITICSCGDSKKTTTTPTLNTSSIQITAASATPTVGATTQLTLSGTMSDGSAAPASAFAGATWSSSNNSVATVDGNGLVTTHAPGTAIITATISGTSKTITITVNGPAPTVSSLSPSTATAGGAAFTLTVIGTNFFSNSVVQWNGSALSTTFVSGTQLTASVPANDIATQGSVAVTVSTPVAGTSGSQSFTINAVVAPVSLSLSPSTASVQVGSTVQLTATLTYSDNSTSTNFTCTSNGQTSGPTWSYDTGKLTAVGSVGAAETFRAVAAGSTSVSASCQPTGSSTTLNAQAVTVTITPAVSGAGYVYLLNTWAASGGYANQIDEFTVKNDGTLGPLQSFPLSVVGYGYFGLASHPSGNQLYIFTPVSSSDYSGKIATCNIDAATGNLTNASDCTSLTPTTYALTQHDVEDSSSTCGGQYAVHPSGNLLYAIEGSYSSTTHSCDYYIETFQLDSTSKAPVVDQNHHSTLAMGATLPNTLVNGMAFSPDGTKAYISASSYTNSQPTGVSLLVMQVDTTTGALTQVQSAPASTTRTYCCGTATVDSTGKFVLVPDFESGMGYILAYSINADGTVNTTPTSSTAATGTSRPPIATSNGYVFVGSQYWTYAYSLDVAGNLTQVAGSYHGGLSAVAVDASGRHVFASNGSYGNDFASMLFDPTAQTLTYVTDTSVSTPYQYGRFVYVPVTPAN